MTDQNDRPSYGQDSRQSQNRPDYGPAGQGPYGQGQGYGREQGSYGQEHGHYGQGQSYPQGPYGEGPQGGWDQQAGSRYGTLPYEAYGQQRLQEPPKYRHLLLATLISLGLYLLSAIPGFLMFGNAADFRTMMEEQMAAEGQTMTAEEAQAVEQVLNFVTGAGLAMMAFFTLIFAGLYLLVYFGLRKRRNWARVTGIVFAILSLVTTLPSLLFLPFMGGGTGLFTGLLSVLFVAVNIWWLVLAFNGQISRYLQQRALMG